MTDLNGGVRGGGAPGEFSHALALIDMERNIHKNPMPYMHGPGHMLLGLGPVRPGLCRLGPMLGIYVLHICYEQISKLAYMLREDK